ncbi:MAG: DNA-3-methyladenine glycosylase I [Solirubrobacteraceae bacterium]
MGDDGVARCWWADSAPDTSGSEAVSTHAARPQTLPPFTAYRDYHDSEWGFPVADDRRLFEKLSLEGFQAGLAWLTILRKRDAFAAPSPASTTPGWPASERDDVARLLDDAAIVRHRGKIEAVINNAQRAVELVAQEGSLARFVWTFEPKSDSPDLDRAGLLSITDESRALAREFKRKGWRFVGPTTVYAFMQAMGLVNDHLTGCHLRATAQAASEAFARP